MTSAPEFLKENVVALTKMNWGCSDSKMPLGLPTFYRQKVCWENYSAIKAGNFLRKKWGISGGRVKTPYCKVKWPGEEKLELGEGIHTLAERPGLAPCAPWNLTYLWTSHYCVHILLPLAKCEDLLQWSTDFLMMIFINVERSFVLSWSVSTPPRLRSWTRRVSFPCESGIDDVCNALMICEGDVKIGCFWGVFRRKWSYFTRDRNATGQRLG